MSDTIGDDGLEWREAPEGCDLKWEQAVAWAEKSGDGWRLPHRYELGSIPLRLVDEETAGWYWTAARQEHENPDLVCAWGAYVSREQPIYPEIRSIHGRGGVWLVRGELEEE